MGLRGIEDLFIHFNTNKKMLEGLKHLLGICGENHPNIFTVIFGSSIVGTYIYQLIFKIKTLKYVSKRSNYKE